ncbi:hypothetical protein A2291_08655 [candidate division WOR-1 bacterium RIFOXYB2_FULL_42_35]|uniref:Radical SAM core domain-containing protein n=1 Tax=candidate division WOR-1 bacterium RIFOXYC2_FULL_41_25 TaxID=1802586 RepID=A0A1F4TLS9_UNCSA|nr:MAG: hypothetical protein A2291_08655 [candidate division WOR-1 bacterium RIFOXYB2_FULL_42_35]OGC23074.1 MAG: hypothetical protein A2247_08555 [candidate division WOR-1 bacterium RIFOXYA2_FULL_41_14]OGC33646.1 MAG: hypothetical protein A2462_02245 [candidate division WOR-1 bacterium RIFOXYC2_FULL_41_25]OGC43609.1 MAG: hypothetical protein A2548_02335 [candidate division WOR-1 bacterium RIFOXYD2_FULL_41_8]
MPTNAIIEELESLPDLELDYITLSGTGEPTLAANLGEVIAEIKNRFNKPVAVLTNSSLMHDPQVRWELSLADLVVAKLDVASEDLFRSINRPTEGFSLEMVINSIKTFDQEYPGKLALQIMFVPQNKEQAKELANLAKELNPVEVQINTPLRFSLVKPLSVDELAEIKEFFRPLKVYSVYDVQCPVIKALDEEATKRRRPVLV